MLQPQPDSLPEFVFTQKKLIVRVFAHFVVVVDAFYEGVEFGGPYSAIFIDILYYLLKLDADSGITRPKNMII